MRGGLSFHHDLDMMAEVNGDTSFYQFFFFALKTSGESDEGVT